MYNIIIILILSTLFGSTISIGAFAIFEHRTNNPNLDTRSRGSGDLNLGIANPLAALENPAYLT